MDLATLRQAAAAGSGGSAASAKALRKALGNEPYFWLHAAPLAQPLLFRADPLGAPQQRWIDEIDACIDALLLRGRGGRALLERLRAGLVDFPGDLSLVDDARRLVREGLLRVAAPAAKDAKEWDYVQCYLFRCAACAPATAHALAHIWQ